MERMAARNLAELVRLAMALASGGGRLAGFRCAEF
jgi:hypothetical protein